MADKGNLIQAKEKPADGQTETTTHPTNQSDVGIFDAEQENITEIQSVNATATQNVTNTVNFEL